MKFTRRQALLMNAESVAMTDIIFLLLIFFLLSSSFILQAGTKINLPVESKPEKIESRHVIITIEASGDVHLNDAPVAMADLEARLPDLLERDPERVVVIRGDESISLGRTIEVMDVAKRMGAQKLAIATKPKPS